MKKTFKFFMCAAIVAAGFVGCSSEEVTPNENPGGLTEVTDGTPTTATFSFKLSGADTKALTADGSENKTVTEFRVLVFNNADGALEVDTVRAIIANDSLLTIPLTSGFKRIYVYANGGITAGPPVSSPAYLGIPAKGSITTVSALNNAYSLVTGASPYTDLANMHPLYAAGKFFYSSTVDSSLISLKPGVSSADSRDPNASVSQGNYINVWLERPVAKVSITKKDDSGPATGFVAGKIITRDSSGIISNVQYRLSGLNAGMFPFKKTGASTPEQTFSTTSDPLRPNFYVDNQGATMANNYIPVNNRGAAADIAIGAGNYYYLPENNPTTKQLGNTSFASVEATFLPTRLHYVAVNTSASGSGVNYNESMQQFIPTAATTDLATASDMYLLTEPGVNGLAVNTLFAGADAIKLAKKIYYHLKNPTIAPKATLDDAVYSAITDTQLEEYFVKYTGGKTYYRLDIGSQATAGAKTDNIVLRNYYYDCNITGFLQLGANTPAKLSEPNADILDGPTNMTVHIIIRDWTGRKIGIDI